jgi:hypothetical protein
MIRLDPWIEALEMIVEDCDDEFVVADLKEIISEMRDYQKVLDERAEQPVRQT